MKKFLLLPFWVALSLIVSSTLHAQFNQFTFLKGNTTDFSIGSYGTQGVASVSNNPGKRSLASSWSYNGKMYLFGGSGSSSQNNSNFYLNDLWQYDATSNNWRWLKGSNLNAALATTGTQGVAGANNSPGARESGASWTLNGKLYLFGGFGGRFSPVTLFHLNDLWEYDPATNNWRWLSGSPNSDNPAPVYGNQGVFDPSNNPGGRERSLTWTYNSKLYLLGGLINNLYKNDLWEYDPSINQWRWISGSTGTNVPGIYGIQGVATNTNLPGGREGAGVGMIGNKTYIFGGLGIGDPTYSGRLDDVWEYDNNSGLWTWLHGSSSSYATKITGTQGVYAALNTPGGREPNKLMVSNNALFIYGGDGNFGVESDLWQYDITLNQWRWVKGPSGVNQLGDYGFVGVEDPSGSTYPGARMYGNSEIINDRFYFFGGLGYSAISSPDIREQNDLWSFDPPSSNWTWLKGSSGKEYNGVYGTQGVASETNKPGGRVAPGSIGANDKFYLFGGNGLASTAYGGNLNDLWEFNPLTNNWKWLNGSKDGGYYGTYGTIGVPSNTNLPPGRQSHMLWNIGNKIYMFGGTTLDYFNDLWEYDLATNNWTWLKGSNIVNQSGNYGTKGVSAATNTPGARWLSATFTYNNKLYLSGGNGYNSGATRGELNDLWEYDPATNNWTWLNGNDAINSLGIYGTIAVPSATNIPGARESGQMQIINNKVYLFGGRGFAVSGGFSNLNDMWEYDPPANTWIWIKGPNTGSNAGVAGSYGIESVANNPSARYYETSWTLNNKFYLFSGTPFGPEYNDVWEYNPATNNWRYIHGTGNIGGQPGNYGLTGIANRLNLPTRRWQSTAAAAGGNAYIFGGFGSYANNSTTANQSLGDLWKWAPGPDGVFTYGSNQKIYVNDNSLTGDTYTTAVGNNLNTGNPSDPLATLDFAVSVAQPGDIIYVDAGTYVTPNFTIGKVLTILGPNSNISPNDASDKFLPNLSRNAESIIATGSITVASNNVTLKGLQFTPLSRNGVVMNSTTLGNFEFAKNKMGMASGGFTGLSLSGTTSLPLLALNFIINDNRFESQDAVNTNTAIKIGGQKNLTLSDNVIIGKENISTARPASGIGISNSVGLDIVTISGNYFDKLSTGFSTPTASNAIFSNNIFRNMDLPMLLLWSAVIPVSNVQITGNQFSKVRSNVQIILRHSGGTSGASNITISDNIFNHDVTGASKNYALIRVEYFGSGTYGLTQVSGNQVNIFGDYQSTNGNYAGIQLAGKHTNTIISNNELSFAALNSIPTPGLTGFPLTNTGIYVQTDPGSTTPNIPASANISILNNKISGFKSSVAFYDPTTTGNAFVGYGNLTSGATVNINTNSFSGDVISINNGITSQTVNATCNWYGVTSSQAVLNKITATTVNYSPWLTSGTDSDIPTVGFQPLPDVCNGTPVTVTLDAYTNITCNGSNNGTISITVSGGVAPYTYSWTKDEDPGFSSSNQDLTNLVPGTYQLTVTDANGSTAELEVTINEPELLTASANGTNNLCFGASEGTATVIVGGGTTPYTYLWSNSETTETITGLVAGTYNVAVTDANGCIANSNYEVTQPTQIIVTIINTSTACANNASALVSGGTGDYTYLWSNGATGTSISSVPAGTYSVTVTDENGCTVTENITLTVNESFNPSASVSDVSCFGGIDGAITVINANGTGQLAFSIDGINFQQGTLPYSFNNLAAGIYTVAVRDINGCTGFVTKTIAQPPLLTVILDNVQSTCFGFSTGSISITASGGSGAMSYSWTGPNGFTSTQRNINTLAIGNYSLTVTDNNGCTAHLNVVVPSFNQITVNSVVTNIACKGQVNGAINLTVTGGTGSGFTFNWSNNANTEDIANLGVGNYNVTITDIGSGCEVTRSYTITQPASVVGLSTTKTNATGCSSLGTITATGSGGTSPYQYRLDAGSYQSSGLFTNLYGGNYTVWVKDANGCTTSKLVSITDNGSDQYESNNSKNQAKLIAFGIAINARIALANDVADWFKFTTPAGVGNYTLTLTHPSVSYTFNMYPAGNNAPALVPVNTTATSKQYVLTGNTTYYISVTGGLSYFCYQLSVTVSVASRSNEPVYTEKSKPADPVSESLKAMVFPNPHQGHFTLKIESPEPGIATILLYDLLGQKIGERKLAVQTGINTTSFKEIRESVIIYKVIFGKNIATGKIIGPN